MSERKVLNKYYPPDFDPSAIPKMRFSKNRTFNIRIMAPFNMRCNTCRGYIYKGKKFNSRKENVDEEFYLGLRIFRFYIKCPTCVAEIAFKTDLKNTDYTLEAGATRLFEAEKLAKEMAEREIQEKEDEELNNPMKILENRTKASRNEIETIDTLEELRELSARQATVETETMLLQHREYEQQLHKLQDEEEEREIRAIFGEKEDGKVLKRLKDDLDSDEDEPKSKKVVFPVKATDILAEEISSTRESNKSETKTTVASWKRSVGGFSNKAGLKGLVKRKEPKPSGQLIMNGTSDDKSSKTSNSDNSTATDTTQQNKISSDINRNPTSSVLSGSKDNVSSSSSSSAAGAAPVATQSTPVISSSLGLLGNYSDSETSDD